MALVRLNIYGQSTVNIFTGVDRAYRRQGALALTLLTIRYAHQHNATRREIFNDSRNTPIFNMPAQLSYYRISGLLHYAADAGLAILPAATRLIVRLKACSETVDGKVILNLSVHDSTDSLALKANMCNSFTNWHAIAIVLPRSLRYN